MTDEIAINVTDATGDEVNGNLVITIVDDVPEVAVTVGTPERGEKTNLTDGSLTSFEDYSDNIWSNIEDKHSATICNGQVTMTAGHIYKDKPNEFVATEDAKFDKGFEDHTKPNLSHGLTVNGEIHDYPNTGPNDTDEIAADSSHSEAVEFTLQGLAYGLNLQLGAFFSAGADDPANEIVRIIFYKGDEIIEDKILSSTSIDGVFGDNGEFSQYFSEGFDRVVITAVDNENSANNSEFVISQIGFVTQPNAMYVTSGTVTAISGADGFDPAYDGNPHTEFAQADGTPYQNGQALTLYDEQGHSFSVTLEIKEGTSGNDKVMTAYRTEDGKADLSQPVFSVNLDQDGNWTFKQYETFHDSPSRDNIFELGFVTEDADGDKDYDSANILLNTDTYGAIDGNAGNSDDTITITGSDSVAGAVVAGDTGGMEVQTTVQPGQDYNISIMLDLSRSMNDQSGSGKSRLAMAKEALETFIKDTIANHDGAINLQLITFNKNAREIGTWKLESTTMEGEEATNSQQIINILSALENISYGNEGTNYTAAFEKATAWFSKSPNEGGVAGNGGENLAFFISDGEPTYYNSKWDVAGTGSDSNQETVKNTLKAAQELQNAGNGVHVNAIGIGTSRSLSTQGQTILDLIDNTGGTGQIQAEYPHEDLVWDGWTPEWKWTTSEWQEDQVLSLGDSDLVNTPDGLTAALTGGSLITSTDLADAGNDTIIAEDSSSSAIVFGDVMNTDQLLHELKQLSDKQLNNADQLPEYGSGTEVFKWLEENGNRLTDTTKFEGWTRDDSIKYMLQHAEELGYETRVDGDGTPYLVTTNGTVLTLDGTEAKDVTLDSLTGRDGGDDTITGSSASDTIYGQEGNDLLVGDPSDNLDEVKDVTVSTIEEMKTHNNGKFESFLSKVEGMEGDGDDMLFGGTGDDVLIGMGGDDYLNGGAGKDAIFGGSGNDIIVYDQNDYMVSGGEGIDFMVTDKSEVTLDTLGTSGRDGNLGPIVDGIDVLIKGDDALSLTNMEQLSEEYGVTIGENNTISLDDRWTPVDGNDHTFAFEGNNLTIEISNELTVEAARLQVENNG
ncbi:VWA domain-containing protein [Desulfovibrio sp. An276]|uniref:VWA domain-containing protein n=1 Tax=Desulfovibrio sp. An276 TaxID=1965618 RepID=UPI001185C601|nr:VWA domain-containing protein [Desulfovibrio sp. An276]